jgi:6-phosphogluconolactonase
VIRRLIAGGYAEAGARGVYPLSWDGGTLAVGQPLASLVNISGGVRLPGSSRWFLVDEAANTITLADAAARWHPLATVASCGEAPCHLALSPNRQRLAVANYESGSVAVYTLDPSSGVPVAPPLVHQGTGRGPVPERQEGPHAHWVGFTSDSRLYIADLGADRVRVLDLAEASLQSRNAYIAPPGSGPRQLAFHPSLPLAFLVSELASTLTVQRCAPDGTLAEERILSTLPEDGDVESLGGAIVLDGAGRRVYVSNRGHDSVATFDVADDGSVSPPIYTSTGGSSPRFLLLLEDNRVLLVAHEKSGGVTALPLDNDGYLSAPVSHADMPGAAFLALLD